MSKSKLLQKSKEQSKVSKIAKTEVSTSAPLPLSTEGIIDFAADAGAGMEGADKDSYAIPFLAILQSNSPQIDTIEGARAGMYFNTVTSELYTNPRIIPCAYQRRWVRWGAREAGGGFKGEYTPSDANGLRDRGEVKELDNRMYFPEQDGSVNPKKSDRLSDTRNHYVLLVDGTGSEFGSPAVLALASTGIKVSKNFMSRIQSKMLNVGGKVIPAPSFSGVYEMSSTKKTNDKGSWWQSDITPVGDVSNAGLYAQAKAFHASVTSGRIKAAHETSISPDESGGSSPVDERF